MSDVRDQTVATTPDREIVISRVLAAPRELAFDAGFRRAHPCGVATTPDTIGAAAPAPRFS